MGDRLTKAQKTLLTKMVRRGGSLFGPDLTRYQGDLKHVSREEAADLLDAGFVAVAAAKKPRDYGTSPGVPYIVGSHVYRITPAGRAALSTEEPKT